MLTSRLTISQWQCQHSHFGAQHLHANMTNRNFRLSKAQPLIRLSHEAGDRLDLKLSMSWRNWYSAEQCNSMPKNIRQQCTGGQRGHLASHLSEIAGQI